MDCCPMASCAHCGVETEVVREELDPTTDSKISYFKCGHYQKLSSKNLQENMRVSDSVSLKVSGSTVLFIGGVEEQGRPIVMMSGRNITIVGNNAQVNIDNKIYYVQATTAKLANNFSETTTIDDSFNSIIHQIEKTPYDPEDKTDIIKLVETVKNAHLQSGSFVTVLTSLKNCLNKDRISAVWDKAQAFLLQAFGIGLESYLQS